MSRTRARTLAAVAKRVNPHVQNSRKERDVPALDLPRWHRMAWPVDHLPRLNRIPDDLRRSTQKALT